MKTILFYFLFRRSSNSTEFMEEDIYNLKRRERRVPVVLNNSNNKDGEGEDNDDNKDEEFTYHDMNSHESYKCIASYVSFTENQETPETLDAEEYISLYESVNNMKDT
ncbi:3107_t:CDS:2 [Diversispora eburnea]|uniref:3107_t:CDS:1 n=1 Tax=Diversispora eburnea TaxID=1213867 RepID=A0A9N9BIJ9_9GLOM|nr:3107_t:CDS:2 [Diversispora eburnea]